jgi:ech hydrogenase subunit A
MELVVVLIFLPCAAALISLFCRGDKSRDVFTVLFSAIIAATSIAFAVTYALSPVQTFDLLPGMTTVFSFANLAIDLTVCAYIICYSIRYRRPLAFVMALFQTIMTVWLEATVNHGAHFSSQIHVDSLSVIMVLIIGIIGCGIIVYALGYMKDFQRLHPDQKDRRPWFFAVMFAFISAMFNIVLSDNMGWIYTAWEVTTLCSFLLIGFEKTEVAINSAFRQIVLNMIGGIAFQVAIAYASINGISLIFSEFLSAGAQGDALFAVPLVLLALAGLTKAAQAPFHSWLLGAMVAPTPTSALLHSSTMVKAGVFLLLKLAPLFLVFPTAAAMVTLVGGFTFMMASFMAISQSNAKRVLAYSTIANLGLIVACAGVGTPEAVWAGIFLVIFHAIAKSLLFLCVGTAEHQIGSRNIEDMDALFSRAPRLARLMLLGCMIMFIAPFGMLISKWATLVSFAETGQLLLILMLAFGSGATFMFWAKWMGKLSGIAAHAENVESKIHTSEWFAIILMAVLGVLACILMPFISAFAVEPYLYSVYGTLGSTITDDNMTLMAISVVVVCVVLLSTHRRNTRKIVPIYLSGVTADADQHLFKASMGGTRKATLRNWYLEDMFGEKRLTKPTVIISAVIIVICIGACIYVSAAAVEARLSLIMYARMGTLPGGWASILAGTGLSSLLTMIIGTVVFAVVGPLVGGLLTGLDRKITARFQGRVGPPIRQPFYDVSKLIAKDDVTTTSVEGSYIGTSLVFTAVAGGVFFSGGNFLMCVFLVTLASLFFVLAAYAARSPYAEIGAERETLQIMSYEPMLIFVAVTMFLTLGTFDTGAVFLYNVPMIVTSIPVFIGLMFILTIKLRKSPFDLSYSEHAHQELVKGITTEMSGRTLAMVEVMHWMESVLFLGWVAMYFVWNNPLSLILGVAVAFLAYLFEIFIDNNFARVKWQSCLRWSWIISLVVGVLNIGGLIVLIAL